MPLYSLLHISHLLGPVQLVPKILSRSLSSQKLSQHVDHYYYSYYSYDYIPLLFLVILGCDGVAIDVKIFWETKISKTWQIHLSRKKLK